MGSAAPWPVDTLMASDDVALRFEHVQKSFRQFASPLQRLRHAFWPVGHSYQTAIRVLSDITFDLPAGQTVAIIGANGAGKSTLLHLAAGLIEASSGSVTAKGRVTALLDLGGSFLPDLTGRENAHFFDRVVDRTDGDPAAVGRAVDPFAETC